MFYEPRKRNHGLPHDPFKALIAPRPIGWITSMSARGEINLAPYSFFNGLSAEPPLVMFAIQHSTGSYASMVSSHAFGVSLLKDTQATIASLFATRGSEKTGKTTFEEGKTLHVPLIPDALAHV